MKTLKIIALSIAGLCAVCAVAALLYFFESPAGPRAFVSGSVLTMDTQNSIHEAVLTDKGIILAVGSDEEILERIEREFNGQAEVIDLAGQTLIPGFIDAHGHFPGSGLEVLSANLNSPPIGKLTTIPQLLSRLEEQAEATKEGRWIIGFGYDDTTLEEARHPTRQELDGITSTVPIFIMHISGHMGVANTAALEAVGYSRDTPDPDGGRIDRDVNGELTGLLLETAARPLQEKMLDLGITELFAMVDYASEEYASVGVTTAQSGATDSPFAKGLEIAHKLKRIPFRLVIFPTHDSLGEDILAGRYDPVAKSDDMFTVGPVKIVTDGSIQGYTGFLSAPYHVPYHGDQSYRGFPTIEQEPLNQLVARFHKAGLQMAIHANGDAAIQSTIDAFRHAQSVSPNQDPRLVVIHSQMATDSQLDEMKELGMTPSFFSAHTYYWGDRHRDIFMGPERAANMSPTASALSKGLPFTVHLDSPVVPMEPLFMVWSTVNRQSSSGKIIGPHQRIPVMRALRAVTIDAAWQVYQEQNRGSIEPGKWADLVVLSGDPLADSEGIRDLEVIRTVVAGKDIFLKQ